MNVSRITSLGFTVRTSTYGQPTPARLEGLAWAYPDAAGFFIRVIHPLWNPSAVASSRMRVQGKDYVGYGQPPAWRPS